MTLECTTCCSADLRGSSCMRPLALAGVSGGFAGAVLQLLKDTAFSDSTAPTLLEPYCDCPRTSGQTFTFWGVEVELQSLVLGLLLGFLLGPLLESLYLLRQLWASYLRSQVAVFRPPRVPSYRVLG